MKAVIITGDKYPCEDAGAIRQHALAKILQELGYEVTVLGYGTPTDGEIRKYDEVTYTSFRPEAGNRFVRALYRCMFAHRVLRYMKRHIPDATLILASGLFPGGMVRTAVYAKKTGASLLHDSVEWYSPEEFRCGKMSVAYLFNDILNRVVIGKGWRVIAISRFLEEHFQNRCDRVVRVPVIMDMDAIKPDITRNAVSKKIRFSYVGSPGKKDNLACLIRGFCLLPEEVRSRLEFHVIGVNEAQLMSMCDVPEHDIRTLGNTLCMHGRVPHSEAVEWVRSADYTMLLRDETLRYAKAGFPTKIVESLAYGTPPVCNLSSDLELYLEDGKNAFMIPGHTPEDVAKTLCRIADRHGELHEAMRAQARRTADSCFDWRLYINEMNELAKNRRSKDVFSNE